MAVKITHKATGAVAVSKGAETPLTSNKVKEEEQQGHTAVSPSGRVKITQRVQQSTTPAAPSQQEEQQGVLSRAGKTLTGAAKGAGSDYANLGGMGLELLGKVGSFLQDKKEARLAAQDREYLAQYEKELADAEARGDAEAAKWAQIKINQANYRLKNSGAMGDFYDDVNRDAVQKVYEVADELDDASAADIEKAKEGLGGFGSALVDAGSSISQSAASGAVGALTGTGLLPFVAQAFG